MSGILSDKDKRIRSNMFEHHNALLQSIDSLDKFIMTNSDFHYMQYSQQVLLKHKVVIMEISRSRLRMLINNYK